MVIFGLLLLLVAVLVVIAAVAHGSDPASLDLQLFTIKTNVTGVFVAGAVTLLLAVLGLALVLWGVRSDRRRRGEIKELRKRASRRDQAEPSPAPQRPSATAPGQPRARPAADGSPGGASVGVPRPGDSGRRSGSGGPPSGSGSTDSSAGPSGPGGGVRRDGPDEHFDSAPRDSGS